mgnify:FL=1|jgi:hypothetical protein
MSMDSEEGRRYQVRANDNWISRINKEKIGSPPDLPLRRKIMISFGKLRPQIFLAIICLSVLAIYGIINGYSEIATATIGGIIALGMKVLENE